MKYHFALLFALMVTVAPPLAHAQVDTTIPTASDVSTSTLEATPITFQLSGTSNDSGSITFATSSDPSDGSLGTIASDGTVTYTPNDAFTGADSFQFTATEGATSSTPATATITVNAPPTPDTATLAIRDGATLIGPVTVDLPADGAPDVDLTATGSTTVHSIPARSVLALLASLETATSTFDISNLDYSYAFGEYLLNCIAIPPGTTSPDCYNWTYAVDGNFPSVGMDTDILQNGDSAYIVFGSQWQVSTDKSTVLSAETFTVTAQEYNPSSGTYQPASGVVVGAVQFDQNFNATEFATSTTDANGQATLSVATAGTYDVGVQAAGYFPNTSVTVSAPTQNSGGGGGGGGGGISHSQFNISNALAYLTSKQNGNGSFDSSVLTDWTAIAFAAENPGAALQSLKNYELTNAPVLSSAADYERHAMALEALGINPYSGTGINYIAPIIADFDGTQIGDPSEDNDDIFALLALLPAGYTANDSVIQKEVAFIVSKQLPDGSWDESPDLTAAAIQALGSLLTTPQSSAPLGEAVGYLLSKEQPNGSWGTGGATNIDSTSWVQTAINAIIQGNTPGFSTESAWASSAGYYPTDAIASAQQSDGAVQPVSDSVDTRVWSTAYAVVAASGQSWDSILQSFSQPSSGGGGGTTFTATSTSATSTPVTAATSTTAVATSTLSVIATSTVLSLAESTTTATTTPHVIHKPKKAIVHHSQVATAALPLPSTTSQTAAAAGSGGGFIGQVWHAITSFFSGLF